MVKYIDISVPLRPKMPAWPDSVGIRITRTKQIAENDACNLTRLDMDVHIGTHVDAPRHFLEEGATIDQLGLNALVGPATVVHFPVAREISAKDLDAVRLKSGVRRLLLRTRNSALWENGSTGFQKDYVGLTRDASQWIVDRGIQLVGIDYLSIQRYQDDPETHRILMRSNVIIIEGLNLAGAAPGDYRLLCLPILLEGAEGAPARAVLQPLSEQ